jgi:ABC-type multidrug transport system fused ATPase/permease subunit
LKQVIERPPDLKDRKQFIRVLAVFVAGSIGSAVRTASFGVLSGRMSRRLREALFGSILQQELLYFASDAAKPATVVDVLMQDVEALAVALTSAFGDVFRYTSSVVSGSFLIRGAFTEGTRALSLLSLGIGPLMGLTYYVNNKNIRRSTARHDQARLEACNFVSERISSISTVRTFAREGYEVDRFGEAVARLQQTTSSVGLATGVFNGTLDITMKCSLVSIVGYGSSLVSEGKLKPSDLSAFLSYVTVLALVLPLPLRCAM